MPNSRHTSVIPSPSSSRPTKQRRSSITELSFHGIHTSRPKAKSVTHVSGTNCHLCLRPLTCKSPVRWTRHPVRRGRSPSGRAPQCLRRYRERVQVTCRSPQPLRRRSVAAAVLALEMAASLHRRDDLRLLALLFTLVLGILLISCGKHIAQTAAIEVVDEAGVIDLADVMQIP